MDKSTSRRSEALTIVDNLARETNQRRDELSKELAELDARRFDLRDTIDILNHQLEGYQAVLERANSPKVGSANTLADFAAGAVNGRATKERW
jgi:uncharacterized coiled-coil DUF342 family protein